MDDNKELESELAYLKKTNESLVESLNELLSLREATQKILIAGEQSEILNLLISKIGDSVKVDTLQVYLYDESNNDYVPFPDGSNDNVLRPEKELIDWTLKEGKPVTLPFKEDKFLTILPMTVKGNPIGMVCIDTTNIADELSQQTLELLSTLSSEAAISLLQTQLLAKVQSQYDLLNNILDSITNGIITLDMNKKITRINRNATAMLEIAFDDVINNTYDKVIPNTLTKIMDAIVTEILENGFAMEQQFTHKLSQGPDLPIAVGASLLRDAAGIAIGIIIVLRDMTASKELERLRKIDQLKSEFVANVSHELKTPLTSIKAYTEALQDMVTDDGQKSFLKVIEEESDRLLFLISDLLNVSRIQAGKLKLSFEPTPPKSIIEEILHISKVKSEAHTITINYADDLPETMLMDKERMKEVVINLLSNAIKYSPKGGEVKINMAVFEKNLKIDVTDQGMGMAPEHLNKIFDQFYRVDTSLTYEISGTGLGLSIVKGVIEGHGGIIKVESEVGKGSTFTVLLPIRVELKRGDVGFMEESFAQ